MLDLTVFVCTFKTDIYIENNTVKVKCRYISMVKGKEVAKYRRRKRNKIITMWQIRPISLFCIPVKPKQV